MWAQNVELCAPANKLYRCFEVKNRRESAEEAKAKHLLLLLLFFIDNNNTC